MTDIHLTDKQVEDIQHFSNNLALFHRKLNENQTLSTAIPGGLKNNVAAFVKDNESLMPKGNEFAKDIINFDSLEQYLNSTESLLDEYKRQKDKPIKGTLLIAALPKETGTPKNAPNLIMHNTPEFFKQAKDFVAEMKQTLEASKAAKKSSKKTM